MHQAALAIDHRAISDRGLLDLLTASQRLVAGLLAHQDELLAEVARRDPQGEEFLRDEAALAMKLAPVTIGLKITAAQQLTGRLSDTHALCRAGDLSGQHARILADAVRDLDDQVTAQVQAAVLPRACEQTPGEFRASVAKAVAQHDRRDVEKRHRDAYSRRRVEHSQRPVGSPRQ